MTIITVNKNSKYVSKKVAKKAKICDEIIPPKNK
jgi:hypothetical protein